jgi:type I restriction enzyme S subunit
MRDTKQGWEIKKLGEVLVKTETVDPTKNPKDEFIYLDVSSVNKETKEIENATVLLGKDAPSRARKLVRTNDVIFATVRPTHSRVAIITEEYDKQVCSTGYFVLRGKDFIFNQYLFYFLLTDEFNEQMEKLQKGASYPAVTDAEVKSILLCFPKSLREQQHIVAILDEAFAAIAKAKANAEQNLKNAKELFESYLQGVFENGNWEEKTLGEVCEYDKTSNKRDDLPYVGLEDIQSNTGIFIGPFEPRSMKSLTFYFNDEHVLYGRLRPYLNKVLLPDFEGHCSTEIFPIKPKKGVLDRGFLFQWLISTETMKKINATWTGATLPRANMNTVLEFKINLPSFNEQQAIVQKLDALSAETKKLEAIYQQKIIDLEELKKSVLQKAFSGQLQTEKVVA